MAPQVIDFFGMKCGKTVITKEKRVSVSIFW